jgi:hypothetical protein
MNMPMIFQPWPLQGKHINRRQLCEVCDGKSYHHQQQQQQQQAPAALAPAGKRMNRRQLKFVCNG